MLVPNRGELRGEFFRVPGELRPAGFCVDVGRASPHIGFE